MGINYGVWSAVLVGSVGGIIVGQLLNIILEAPVRKLLKVVKLDQQQ